MKKLIIILSLTLPMFSFAQDDVIPTHTISFQSGFYDRGLLGMGYDFNGPKKGAMYFNVNTSVGVGLFASDANWFFDIDPSLLLTVGPSLNIGGRSAYFTIGPELKYMMTEYEGASPGVGAIMGGTFNVDGGFVFKIRTGFTYWSDFGDDGPGFEILYTEHSPITAVLGLSVGYGFKMR